MLSLSSICCTPMIRGSRWSILLQFGNKAPFRKAEKPKPETKERNVRVWSWIGGLEWLKLASRYPRTMNEESREQQHLDKELWGRLLAVRRCYRRRRGLWLTTIHCFISLRLILRLVHCQLCCWILKVKIQMTLPQCKTNCLLFNLSLVSHFIYSARFYNRGHVFWCWSPCIVWRMLSRLWSRV
jgi:hypothetical protein